MRPEYTYILDEMMTKFPKIDGRCFLPDFLSHDIISVQEREKFYKLGPSGCTKHLIAALKLREDEDMIHFLNSLKKAKYEDEFHWLDEKLENRSLTNKHIWFDVRDPTLNFIGRNVQLRELHYKMLQIGKKGGAYANKVLIVTGLGGIGKTQLACRYVQLYSQQFDNNIIWINAESDATLRNSFINLAENLNINIKNANGVEKETARILKDIYAHLSLVKCLIVFDNADKTLKDDFYSSSRFQIFILITSRYQNWGPINILNLDNFSPEEATDFIRVSLKITTDIGEDQITNLAKTLHFFPLALKQATAYFNETSEIKKNIGIPYSIDDYIKEYNENKEKLLNYKVDFNYGNENFQTTFTTWKITIDKLDQKGAETTAINVLEWISYFAHEQIDMQIFVQHGNAEEIGVAVGLLKDYSLITEENGLFKVHPLVQEVTRLNIKQNKTEKETFTIVCRLVLSYFVHLERSNDYFKQKILLPHSEKLLQEMKNWLIENPKQQKNIEKESIKNLLISMSNAYNHIGKQLQNKSVLEQLLSIKIEHYGPDHYEVAITLTNLGNAYGALGQPDKQKTLLEKALAIQEKYYGPDHYQVAITLANLGNAYGALGLPEKKKTLLEKALAIQEKHYGPDYYQVAITLTNLGNGYGSLGLPEKKKTLLEKALAMQEKHYGSDHYLVAITLTNLGNAYGALGQPEKEKTLLEKALVMQEKHYGPDHYLVAITLASIGNAYGALGQPEKQKTWLEKALVIKEKHYGSDHYEFVKTLANLGIAYGALGQHEKEKTLLEKVLVMQEKHYGPDHYEVAITLVNLGNAYAALGQPEKQKTLLEKALVMQEKHYGPDHYLVAITLTSLGNAYGALEQPDKQKTLLEKALPIIEKHYGSDHYKVAVTLTNLGNCYGDILQPKKQKTLLEKALVIDEKHYGPDHYEVAIILANLGNAYGALEQHEKQKTLLEKALPILEKHYGPDHYQVAITLKNLGNCYGALLQPEKQKTLLEKALPILEKHYGQGHYEVAMAVEI